MPPLFNESDDHGSSYHSNASSDADVVPYVYLENYSQWIKIAFVSCGIVSLLTSIVAIVITTRTKRTPYAARFLSKALLIFDVLYIMNCSVRKFVMEPHYNLNLNVSGQVFVQLSYLTVGIMSLERLVVFNWPIFYIKHCSENAVRIIAAAIWTTATCLYLIVRYGGCYLQHSSIMLVQAGLCTKIVSIYYSFFLSSVLTIAIVCYCKIFQIVRNKTSQGSQKLSLVSAAKVIKGYKSTFIVVLYLMVIVLTSMAYLIIMIMRYMGNLNVTQLRLSIELVSIMNCILDPYLYVLWFRESQMELLKLFCPWNETVRNKIEAMRTDIYDIVTSEMHKLSPRIAPSVTFPIAQESRI